MIQPRWYTLHSLCSIPFLFSKVSVTKQPAKPTKILLMISARRSPAPTRTRTLDDEIPACIAISLFRPLLVRPGSRRQTRETEKRTGAEKGGCGFAWVGDGLGERCGITGSPFEILKRKRA
ncbi:hypothetical protein BHM03_00053984 [Ensete ventricosum]|nr:hypothetical protein BHM03_00053984 [Ensete ventricosum]